VEQWGIGEAHCGHRGGRESGPLTPTLTLSHRDGSSSKRDINVIVSPLPPSPLSPATLVLSRSLTAPDTMNRVVLLVNKAKAT
jgi:hypothetical protein